MLAQCDHAPGGVLTREQDNMDWMRIKNDVNGNPRWVCHWLTLESKPDYTLTLSERYARALQLAKTIGGRKFHNKQFGGGIVFQCYGPDDIQPHIDRILSAA
jgi:hypothetical protein